MTQHPTDDALAKALRRYDATIRHHSGVTVLLERRPDLEGVVPMADLIHESVRWAA
ncbi:hypothetical protein LRP67_01770 [Nocardioides sp. cx-169]|uniref:hypothetical protein n=1 Tax=Nocardioides sp. cx-169 TaxID=2899080 RepID=UPI001E34C1AD|nr:hypothetical protein [Nocardioides sp. cx-169]MCD4532813.1 hypothetical protein [Nocardioides sp. cx-169]